MVRKCSWDGNLLGTLCRGLGCRLSVQEDTGNSTGSAAKPNVPPAAPDAVARARCNNSDPVRGDRGRVRNATFSAASSPFEVADVIAFEANAGRANPRSS